jgi:nicotinate-nucleotide adenylyltransferase
MVERAVAGIPGISVDATEVANAESKPGPSYTVETLERQRRLHGPQRPLVLLLGADAFARLEAWHRWRDLFDLAHIAVATRPGHQLIAGAGGTALDAEFAARRGQAADLAGTPAGRIVPFAITALEISASAIRQRLAQGLSVRHLVPDAVLDYIESHQIYRTPHGH